MARAFAYSQLSKHKIMTEETKPWTLNISMGVGDPYIPSPPPPPDYSETPLRKAIEKIKERASVMSLGEALSILRELLPYEKEFIEDAWKDGDESHSYTGGEYYRYNDFDEYWGEKHQGENDERSVATDSESERPNPATKE